MATPEEVSSYCKAAAQMGEPHLTYHNTEYGFPAATDNELFRRLILEINQAGLSWTTILNKRDGFAAAYDQFDIEKVAAYGEDDVSRLLEDARIIRNKLKVRAAVFNAQAILPLQQSHGSFDQWLSDQGALDISDWIRLFRRTFKFTGGEITREFLTGTGYLPGAHNTNCPIFATVLKKQPAWLRHAGST